MKIAYLILAHDSPRHLERLIAALSSDASTCFVHIDRTTPLEEFEHLRADTVHFTHARVSVTWGDFSQVEAILALIRAAVADAEDFDRFVLLSGADYPLRSSASIEHFFQEHSDREFMNLVEIPDETAGKPLTRLTIYQPAPGRNAMSRAAKNLFMRVGRLVYRRDYATRLGGRTPYGGSTWWALTRGAVEHLVDVVDAEPGFVEFFRHSICPDETFFQTILGNSRFAERIGRNVTYVDWSSGGANPTPITATRLEQLVTGDAFADDDVYGHGEFLFTRKFSDDDGEIIRRLDALITEQEE